MGSDFHWLMCGFEQQEFDFAKSKLANAIQEPQRTDSQKEALELYQNDSLMVLPKFIPTDQLPADKKLQPGYEHGYIEPESFYHFLNAFWLAEIGDEVLQLPLSEQNVLSWENYDHQPFALLVFALGLSFNDALPGVYGNMFIEHEKLPYAIEKTEYALKKVNETTLNLLRRSFSVCSAGNISLQFEQDIEKLCQSLPKQMKQAYQQHKHFAAFTFWMG